MFAEFQPRLLVFPIKIYLTSVFSENSTVFYRDVNADWGLIESEMMQRKEGWSFIECMGTVWQRKRGQGLM